MTKSSEARPHPKLGNSQRYVLKALKKHRGLADFDSKQYKITTEGEIALDTCNG